MLIKLIKHEIFLLKLLMFSFSFIKGGVVQIKIFFILERMSAVASYRRTCGIHNSKCLCVFNKLRDIWILVHSPSLTLLSKKIFQGILADSIAKKHSDTRNDKNIFYHFHKRTNYIIK